MRIATMASTVGVTLGIALAIAPACALAGGPKSARATSVAVNERAAHEPRRSGDYARFKHPSGCGCCSGARRGATVTAPSGAKAFPSKRPWMISH